MDRALTVAKLGATPRLLRRLTGDVPPNGARRQPRPGEWSIAEVVAHLAEGDHVTFLPRLRRMLAEERPVFASRSPEPADLSDLAALLGMFEAARREVVGILEGLEPSTWLREAVSPSRGAVSVEGYAALMAEHDTEHLRQIHEVRSAVGLPPRRTEARVALPLDEIAAAIEPVPRRIELLCRDLSAERLRRRPGEGEWSMKEVMAHLLKVERDLFLPRLRRMVEEERPRFEPFDPDAWAAERDHREGDFAADLAAFQAARQETRAFLRSLPPEAADRIGLSGGFGPLTFGMYATHIVDHDIEHLAQLEACRDRVGR
jgi:uncharacterized damage-inducible protein DinB